MLGSAAFREPYTRVLESAEIPTPPMGLYLAR
jgi:hypothetical protein